MIDTTQFKNTMQHIKEKLAAEKELFAKNRIDARTEAGDDDIDNLIRKSEDTSFRLLIMGQFSSGKSSFINVLLGEKLLPVKALPATALITEIYYGERPRVIMFPRPGKWSGGSAPFDIEPSLSEIAKYSTINNKSGINTKEANRVDSCFEKMVVYWPLDMLKGGVSIIDSPGTNDPYSNDHIVEEYVPKADAILYCVNGTNAYNSKDKNTLDRLNSIGFKPIIVTTYFDVVTNGLSEDEIQEFVDTTYQSFYANHTTRECCHYIDSLRGLHAKENHVHSELVESGYYELEKFLGEYLSEHKGREKLDALTAQTKIFNENQKKQIGNVIANLSVPQAEFDRRIGEAEKKLEQAKLQGDLLAREFRVEAKQAKTEICNMIPSLYETLYNHLNLDDFQPDTSFSMWHPKQSSQQIAEECAKELELRNKNIAGQWCNETLMPKLEESLKRITRKMKDSFDTFDEDIKRVNISLTMETGAVDSEVGTGTRVAMVAYALLTGDWMTALMGGVFGAGAFGRTLVCEFVAGMALGIISLFTPVGLPALVIASIAAIIGGAGWTASKAASAIKSKTVEKMKEEVAKQKDTIIENVKTECTGVFDDAEKRLQEAVDADIQGVVSNMELIRKERAANLREAETRRQELNAVLAFLKDVNGEMDRIRKEAGI